MKKEDLKKLIKPLIKECLREVLIEEGFTKMLSESVQHTPLQAKQQIVQKEKAEQNITLNELRQNRKQLLDSIGNSGFDAFAGTQPLREDKELTVSDPGVDISGLMQNKQIWKQTLDAMKGKKVKE